MTVTETRIVKNSDSDMVFVSFHNYSPRYMNSDIFFTTWRSQHIHTPHVSSKGIQTQKNTAEFIELIYSSIPLWLLVQVLLFSRIIRPGGSKPMQGYGFSLFCTYVE